MKARGENQRRKLLYLAKIFMEKTDDAHALTRQQLIQALAAYDVSEDRKTLYSDLEELRTFGFDIITDHEGNVWSYHIGGRTFELPELELLVDAVQSSRFITERKSRTLIEKLEKLTSLYEARQLQSQVSLSGRVKATNETIYYNVDKLHTAISTDSRIRFQYCQWDVKKNMVPRHNGAWYNISPWALVQNSENYYLIGYDAVADCIKHYRVDKMRNVLYTGPPREGKEKMQSFDLSRYTRQIFGMYGGEETLVSLRAKNSLVGVLIDRFGKELPVISEDDGTFTSYVSVEVSRQFLSWVIGLGPDIQITGPDHVVDKMREEIRRLTKQYLD